MKITKKQIKRLEIAIEAIELNTYESLALIELQRLLKELKGE